MADNSFDDAALSLDRASASYGRHKIQETQCPGCGTLVSFDVPASQGGMFADNSSNSSGDGGGVVVNNLKMEMGDLASSLDLEMDPENEKKFNAIKVLYLRKLKAIMTTVDEKEKEILKLKVMSKDNRRTQMIQALKNKVQEKELVIDVLKEEFVKNKIYTPEEVNDAIIKKTTGGPKRFRPLTREELENKVLELERQLSRKSNLSSAASLHSTANSVAESKTAVDGPLKNNYNNSGGNHGGGSNSNAGGQPSNARRPSSGSMSVSKQPLSGRSPAESKTHYSDDKGETYPEEAKRHQHVKMNALSTMQNEIIEFGNLVDELSRLRALDVAHTATIEKQRGEIVDLRARNAQLAVQEDTDDFLNRELQECKLLKDESAIEIESLTRQLGVSMEENMQLRAEIDVSFSDRREELEISKDQCQRLLKQNGALLEQLADLEAEMEARFGGFTGISGALRKEAKKATERDASTSSSSSSLKALTSQLAAADTKIAELSSELKPMKDTLREKNVVIKDLNKSLDAEKKKVADLLAKISSNNSNNNSAGGNNAISNNRIATKEEGKM